MEMVLYACMAQYLGLEQDLIASKKIHVGVYQRGQ
jgi:hypothetical protein